jgi:hypothetical protein
MSGGENTTKMALDEKRCEPREPARDPARLLLKREIVVEALIVDRSLKGMRLRLPHDALVAYSSTLTTLDLSRGMILQVKVIWKAYPDIGVQVQSSFNIRTGEGPEAAKMRRLWQMATASRV